MPHLATRRLAIRALPAACAAALLAAIAWLAASPVHAHAVVRADAVDTRGIVARRAAELVLPLSAEIETGLAQVTLQIGTHGERPLDVTVNADRRSLRIALPPLEPGEYRLRIRVFARDGHVSRQSLPLRVPAPR
ncbi:MAG: copper resistance protein CopC [Gammaproteobacteria bacterium]